MDNANATVENNPAVDQDIEQPVDQATEAAAPAPAPDTTRYAVVKAFTPKRGFETVLLTQLSTGAQTADEATAAILASGEYQRVAPRAAELRPGRPVATCIRQWLADGSIVALADGEEAPAALESDAPAVAETEGGDDEDAA